MRKNKKHMTKIGKTLLDNTQQLAVSFHPEAKMDPISQVEVMMTNLMKMKICSHLSKINHRKPILIHLKH